MKKIRVLSKNQMSDLESFDIDIRDASAYIFKDTNGFKVCFLEESDKITINTDSINVKHYYLNDKCAIIPVYTLEDILDKLPEFIMIDGGCCQLIISKDKVKYENIYTKETMLYQPIILSILSSAFEVFKYLLKNKLI